MCDSFRLLFFFFFFFGLTVNQVISSKYYLLQVIREYPASGAPKHRQKIK